MANYYQHHAEYHDNKYDHKNEHDIGISYDNDINHDNGAIIMPCGSRHDNATGIYYTISFCSEQYWSY